VSRARPLAKRAQSKILLNLAAHLGEPPVPLRFPLGQFGVGLVFSHGPVTDFVHLKKPQNGRLGAVGFAQNSQEIAF
jgi:hypothetical protein